MPANKRKVTSSKAKHASKTTKLKFGNRIVSTRLAIFVILFAFVGVYFLIRSYAATAVLLHSSNLDQSKSVGATIITETSSTGKKNQNVIQLGNFPGVTKANATLTSTTIEAGSHKVCLSARAPSKNISGGIFIKTFTNGTLGSTLGQEIYTATVAYEYNNVKCLNISVNSKTSIGAEITNATDGGILRIGNVSFTKTGNPPPPPPTAGCSSTDKPHGGPDNTWRLDFCDEFNDNKLDLGKWQPNWLASGDTEITKASNGLMLNCEDPSRVVESDNSLKLILDDKDCNSIHGSRSYTSGLVNSSKDYTFDYGYAEVKMKMPTATNSQSCANWPGFWTNGRQASGIDWPVFLESDVMECLRGSAKANVHSGPSKDNDSWKKSIDGGYSAPGADWHIYAANLERGTKSCSGSTPDPARLTYYYDGSQIGQPYETCFKNTGQYLILQNDIEELSKRNSLPSTVEFEYVRVWKR